MASPQQRVGEYVLQDRIAAGTFGEVWRAHHHVWHDRVVAVKIPTDPQYLRNLQREGVAIHGLTHPNIVRALGFDPYADPPYLTMEYVPGTSLRPLVQGRSLSIPDAVAVMRQVLAGLTYAHDQGLVHRDVKPENILVHEGAARDGYGTEGVIKVTDFGLGRAAASTAVGSIVYSASLNDAAGKEIAGTLDYMAPEQRSGSNIDRRADLYACGVVLYELLTGERPAGTDLPSDVNPKVPKWLDEVFRRSYARLDKRFATAADFMNALSAGSSAAAPPPLPRTSGLGPSAAGFASAQGAPPQQGAATRTTCPHCRQAIATDDNFCMHCGVQLVTHVRRCTKCGAYPDPRDRFCILCGEGLHAAAMT
jgi:serine/threonine protein kinase